MLAGVLLVSYVAVSPQTFNLQVTVCVELVGVLERAGPDPFFCHPNVK